MGVSKFSDFDDGFRNFYYYQFTRLPSVNNKVYDEATTSDLTFNPNPQYKIK